MAAELVQRCYRLYALPLQTVDARQLRSGIELLASVAKFVTVLFTGTADV